MNYVVAQMEQIRDSQIQPAKRRHEPVFIWHVTRPSKRKGKRIHVCFLYYLSKKEFADWWIKYAKNGWTARASKVPI